MLLLTKLIFFIVTVFLLAACTGLNTVASDSSLNEGVKAETSSGAETEAVLAKPIARPAPVAIATTTSVHASPTRDLPKVIVNKPDRVMAQLYTAPMVFSMPDKVNIKDTFKVQLLIDPSKGLTELLNSLTVEGTKAGSNIKIAKVVIVNLSAADFDIERITPAEQAVAETEPTEWLWSLRAKSAGKHSVTLSVTAVIKINGKETTYHIKTVDRAVEIEVTPHQIIASWFDKYWQWLFTTILLPIGIWIYKKRQ